MDQIIINWLFVGLGSAFGVVFTLLVKVIWAAVQKLQEGMRQIERDLPDLYVRKDDWRSSLHDLREDMQRGFDKLDKTISRIFEKIDVKINDK